jgi:hypothetical protein
MPTEDARQTGGTRRLAVVLARYGAAPGAPPGIDPGAFATACLADSYEVAAELTDVEAGIAGPPNVAELLWPGDGWWPGEISLPALAGQLTEDADELVLLAADVPDLPGLVLAKIFKALRHADVVVAPERRGDGCVAPSGCRWLVGFRPMPWTWIAIRTRHCWRPPRAVATVRSRRTGTGCVPHPRCIC